MYETRQSNNCAHRKLNAKKNMTIAIEKGKVCEWGGQGGDRVNEGGGGE